MKIDSLFKAISNIQVVQLSAVFAFPFSAISNGIMYRN
jgi:hypothetical protein